MKHFCGCFGCPSCRYINMFNIDSIMSRHLPICVFKTAFLKYINLFVRYILLALQVAYLLGRRATRLFMIYIFLCFLLKLPKAGQGKFGIRCIWILYVSCYLSIVCKICHLTFDFFSIT